MLKRTEFPRVAPREVGVDAAAVEWLLDQLEYGGFTEPHSLMLMKDGQIFTEGWWAPFAPHIVHGLQSHTKTYAATAIGIAYTKGLLDLNERIVDIFMEDAPDNPSENLQNLKIRDVLCMGCGMEEMPAPSKQWIRDFLHIPVVHPPGTAFMYNSMGSTLLSAIIYRKTRKGLDDFLKDNLFDKIGINASSHKWMSLPDGTEIGGGGLLATTEDNLRLMKLYADGGVWDGEQILAPEYVQLATTMQNDSASEEAKNPPAKDNFVGYGYQIWMCRPQGVYRADGAFGQFTIVVPDMNMIMAITEMAPGAENAQHTLDVFWEFLDKIRYGSASGEEADDHLALRLKKLALPSIPQGAYSETAEKVNNITYTIKDSTFTMLEGGAEIWMTGAPLPSPITRFSFTFENLLVRMTCTVGKETFTLQIPMDGSLKENTITGGTFSKALMGAWWEGNALHIFTRWVEGCTRQERIFTFEDRRVSIDLKTNGFLSQKQPTIIAVEK